MMERASGWSCFCVFVYNKRCILENQNYPLLALLYQLWMRGVLSVEVGELFVRLGKSY